MAYAGPGLVLAHLEKTGGTSAHRLLAQLGYLDPACVIPDEEAHEQVHRLLERLPQGTPRPPVIGGVRCPTRWYLSMVTYLRRYRWTEHDPLAPFVAAVGDGTAELVRAMVDPDGCGVAVCDLVHRKGYGLMTDRFLATYGTAEARDVPVEDVEARWPDLCLLDLAYDCDRLVEALPLLLGQLGLPMAPHLKAAVAAAEHQRATIHATEAEAFSRDPELPGLIMERERMIVRLFGYTAGEPSPAPAWCLRYGRPRALGERR